MEKTSMYHNIKCNCVKVVILDLHTTAVYICAAMLCFPIITWSLPETEISVWATSVFSGSHYPGRHVTLSYQSDNTKKLSIICSLHRYREDRRLNGRLATRLLSSSFLSSVWYWLPFQGLQPRTNLLLFFGGVFYTRGQSSFISKKSDFKQSD